ncbi:sodium-dependent transporter [Helicobacter sp.]|uniref:sodium-dependent transporter n=1 Tax=Helicobacter sp. TaxID=218 RepID=UPI0025BB99E8|nr:sodium-dependent transporter [Helicobacter sp.]MBR2494504.1 sodium-dependent transporter [Helicobacter sp.]
MKRQIWSSRLTYILTVAGATIGFGATWRFPYLVGEYGGGAYVAVFVLAMLFVGIPIILVENVIGRRAHTNCVDAFGGVLESKKPVARFWRVLGYMSALGAFGILAYYMVIGGWVLSYIVHIAQGILQALGLASGGFDVSVPLQKSQTIAFYEKHIQNAPWQISFFTFVFVAINWLILRKGVIDGIERSVKYLMPLLLLCLVLMVVRNLTLDGAMEGIRFYLVPDFSALSAELFLYVIGQVFFALSLGFGVMITLSSHLDNQEDLVKTSLFTGVINTLIAVLAGFMIFPSLFSANLAPDSGPSLVFKVLPVAFSYMHFGSIFAIMFFVLLLVAALTTSITIYQVIISILEENFHIPHNKAINYTLLGVFVLGNIPCALSSSAFVDVVFWGRSVFDTFDFLSGNVFFVLTALGASVFVGFVLREEALQELANGTKVPRWLLKGWLYYVRYGIPIIIVAIFIGGILDITPKKRAQEACGELSMQALNPLIIRDNKKDTNGNTISG